MQMKFQHQLWMFLCLSCKWRVVWKFDNSRKNRSNILGNLILTKICLYLFTYFSSSSSNISKYFQPRCINSVIRGISLRKPCEKCSKNTREKVKQECADAEQGIIINFSLIAPLVTISLVSWLSTLSLPVNYRLCCSTEIREISTHAEQGMMAKIVPLTYNTFFN